MSYFQDIYKKNPKFVLGFQGCDEKVGRKVISGAADLAQSANEYDWLGTGTYFWEGSPERALKFAQDAATTKKMTTQGLIITPFVVGAIIDLGWCLSLFDDDCIHDVAVAYENLLSLISTSGTELPKNVGGAENLRRVLDCSVINLVHVLKEKASAKPYDSVRSAFHEGGSIYDTSGFTKKAHIQIAVREPKCILGYFLPKYISTASDQSPSDHDGQNRVENIVV